MARQKALEKLANFQLERESAWILKVIQGTVAAGCSFLMIRQTDLETQITLDPQEVWSVTALEEAFFDPEVSPYPGINHCKRGLWAVGIRGKRPFRWAPAQSDTGLIWDGLQMHQKPNLMTR